MGGVFYFCPTVFKHLSRADSVRIVRIFLVVTILGALVTTIDIWTNFKITFFVDPPRSPKDLGASLKDAEMNLGHAITVWLLLFAPVTILLKSQFRYWKSMSVFFLILIVAASVKNDLWVGFIGAITVVMTMLFAFKFGHRVLVAIIGLAIAAIFLAPLLAFISSQLAEADLGNIPRSWEHRLKMWGYCWSVIIENLFFGDGFDSARTYTAKWTTREGFDLSIVSLHPHNAGIHIWTETGLVGALLACGVLLSLLKPIKAYATTSERSVMVSGVLIIGLLISSTTYGAWHSWWWGVLFLCVGVINSFPNVEDINK